MARVAFLIVPGRDDRAFYKSFLSKILERHGFCMFDFNRNTKKKIKILKSILPDICRRTAILSIRSNNKELKVVVWPDSNKVTERASNLLNYQAGLEDPMINLVVVAEDAEDLDFSQRLTSLYDSLNARAKEFKFGKLKDQGNTYLLYMLNKPQDCYLLLLAQGLPGFTIGKRAVEDYLLYIHRDLLEEIESKYRDLFKEIKQSDHAHKKLTLLLALKKCGTCFDDLAFKLDKDEVETLIKNCDGLARLVKPIEELI